MKKENSGKYCEETKQKDSRRHWIYLSSILDNMVRENQMRRWHLTKAQILIAASFIQRYEGRVFQAWGVTKARALR